MDEIDNFFDFGVPFTRQTVAPVIVRNVQDYSDIEVNKGVEKREVIGTEYVAKYQKAEMDQLAQTFSMKSEIGGGATSVYSTVDDLESIKSEAAGTDPGNVRTDEVHTRYKFNYVPPNLPISDCRMEIVASINENPVIVLQGSTGCGKTTQVPQMILAEAFETGEYCNIIVTQPRRLAAQSIAQRVCSECHWPLGSIVGYQVGLSAKASEDTRLLYCTTGVLLEKLVKSKTMANYTHVILDEVHERDQDMDFLFIIVRRLLATNSPHVKVILMSATIEAPIFAEYFQIPKNGTVVPAPIINIEKKSLYTVREFYLDQLERLKLDLSEDISEPTICDGMYKAALKLCIICDRLDTQEETVNPSSVRSAILIFLPGIYEIDRMYKEIEKWLRMNDTTKYMLIVLHSSITTDEQQQVFRLAPPNYRKIILSTNIAESSITVPDVKYVIDFCLTKLLITDTATNFTSLKLEWASRNSCRQRSGRAGRVMNGRVYRLVPRYFFENVMQESTKPEMLRSPLEKVVLKAKMLDMGPPHAILALAMDQPNLSDIDNTILILKEAGALLKGIDGVLSKHDGDLTFIGRVMANLPVDISIARLLIFGYCFSVLEDCIIIGAGLTVKSIFANPKTELLQAYSAKVAWSNGSGSDLLAILRAFKTWRSKHTQGDFTEDETETQWTRRYKLQVRHLKEMAALVKELTQRLERLGIKELTGVHRATWTQTEKNIILKIVIAGAFYPNYFVRPSYDEEYSDREAFNVLHGRDPCTTVFFTGFEPKYIGPLYAENIKSLLSDCTPEPRNMLVSFEKNSQKIFVTFRQNTELYGAQEQRNNCVEMLPGKVATEVYKAVKWRKLHSMQQIPLKVMHPSDAVQLAEARGLGMWEMGEWVAKSKYIKNKEMICLPRLSVKEVQGEITQINDIDRFWIRPSDEDSFVKNFYDELNQPNSDLEPYEEYKDIILGQLLAAPYNDSYYRARAEYYIKRADLIFFKVYFVDIGNYSEIEFSNLRKFRGISAQFADIPPRIFECRLADIRPSSLISNENQWNIEALRYFERESLNRIITAEIYSVVNGVASVIIHANGKNINRELISRGYGQLGEESYMSRCNHELRLRRQACVSEFNFENDDELVDMLGDIDDCDTVPPPKSRCYVTLHLRGPTSPLETKVTSAMISGFQKAINIDPQSVNSVLLNAGQDPHEKLLVAATISQTPSHTTLMARETTLMPNIRGFAALMALIFCPYMEPLRDKIHSRYISILTGLGMDPKTRKSLFEEHDSIFYLDVDITQDDLKLINQIRFTIDSLLFTLAGEERPNIPEKEKKNYSQKIKNYIITLLEKDRPLQPIQQSRHVWGMMNPDDCMKPTDVYGERTIFALHSGLTIEKEDSPNLIEYYQKMNVHCAELHRMTVCETNSRRSIKCRLCDQEFATLSFLRVHLYSRLHMDLEAKVKYFPRSDNN